MEKLSDDDHQSSARVFHAQIQIVLLNPEEHPFVMMHAFLKN